jgi:hypothetical protein
MRQSWRPGRLAGWVAAIGGAIAAVLVLLLVLSAVHALPQLRNPFRTTTTVTSQPPLLKSITTLSRFEAASGTFQVVVVISQHTSFLPSFVAGSQTLFIGSGTVIAYVNFSHLKGNAITVASTRSVTVRLPKAQLEPAVLNVRQSYVFAEQQGVFNRIGDFFAGNPNSQQAAYVTAERKIDGAAASSPLVADAQRNTTAMLDSMLGSLGYQHVTVEYGR